MSIWTEWDPLEEIIVGNCHESIPESWNTTPKIKEYLNRIFKETKEDLDDLSKFIESFGVKVHRPKLYDFKEKINLPNFEVFKSIEPIAPRDQYFVYGKNIYQTYTSMPDRYFDSYNYYDIFLELFKQGYNWLSQPPPMLKNFDNQQKIIWYEDGLKIYREDYKNLLLWHTAAMFKCGDSLIANWKGPGTLLGLKWMAKNINGEILFNNDTASNSWGHIDHGFYMIDDNTVICANINWVPTYLRNKKIIEIENFYVESKSDSSLEKLFSIKDKHSEEWLTEWFSEWRGYNQLVYFATNVLIIDSNNVIVSSEQEKIFKLLEPMGIKCHVSKQRHLTFWDAGIHCLTLDIKRKGECRSICK